jgi:SAM-dependent methyltransferase/uncharacterized protein YbaR (Trm112 family)
VDFIVSGPISIFGCVRDRFPGIEVLDVTTDSTGPTTARVTSVAEAPRVHPRLRSLLASPCCLGPLEERGDELACVTCGRSFPFVEGVPVLLPQVPPEWLSQTETKVRFAKRPKWWRHLLYPRPTTEGHQRRRLREFVASLPPSAAIVDLGSSLRRLSPSILCLDLIPTPGVDLVGDLHRIPLRDDALDAIICTGVLEHVEDANRVVEEFWRVLRPGGRVYASLPFLQGYHPSPTDFRRFTRDGARQLFTRFQIDQLVNTRGSASTVTWVLSVFLAELFSFGNLRLYVLARALFGWLLLPLKYLDYLIATNPFDHYITSGFTVLARKRTERDRGRGF